MNFLSVEGLSKRFGVNLILDKANFGVEQGEKVALVGINGSGKSTLLKMIMGTVPLDEGDVRFRKGIRIAFLEQNPSFSSAHSVIEHILDGNDPSLVAIKSYEKLLKQDPVDQEKLADVMAEMDRLNAWDMESQIKQILGKLNLHDLSIPVSRLSGGQKKRVALARILIEKPDFFIMDEPTNHLDLDIIEWLEEYISHQKMTLLLVTHDRYFLDSVTNKIVEIDEGKLYSYQGNYKDFLEKKEERIQHKKLEIDKARNLMRKELEWMRRQPKARGTKAKYRIDAFYNTKDQASQTVRDDKIDINMSMKRAGKKILEVKDLHKAYGENILIKNFDYVFKRGDRIGIIGPNGAGKSTFLDIIMGRNEPDAGTVDYGQNTKFGYYTQEELVYKPDQKVIDIVSEIADHIQINDKSTLTASQLLNTFGFPPKKQHEFVKKLSGGEKRRLQLLRVLMGNPNFLILDEPTNDLDILTLNTLEEYLDTFPGCILMVSHDRYFMDRITDHLFVFKGQGEIGDFPGNFTDYREVLKEEKNQESLRSKSFKNKPEPKEIEDKQSSKRQRKLTYKEKLEWEQLEKSIDQLEEKKNSLLEKLNSGETDHEKIQVWSTEIGEIESDLEEKEMRWLELSEIAEPGN